MSQIPERAGLHGPHSLRRLAADMRTNAAQTDHASYAFKLRKAADDLDAQANLLERAPDA